MRTLRQTAVGLIAFFGLVAIGAAEQAAPSWRELGVQVGPELVVFSRKAAPPENRYFIPERMTQAGVVAQYEEPTTIESLRQSMKHGNASVLNVGHAGFMHLRSDGKWRTWSIVTDEACTGVGVQFRWGLHPQVLELPWAFVPLLQGAAILPAEIPDGSNVLAPPVPGFSIVKITDPSRLKAPVGLGAHPEEASRSMASPEVPFDPAAVQLKVYVPRGYRDDVPHGLIVSQGTYSDVSKVNYTRWTPLEFDRRRLIYVIVAGERDDRGSPARWHTRMWQEARKFACRNYHIQPGRCYLAQHQSAALVNIASQPHSFDASFQLGWMYCVTSYSKETGTASINEKSLPRASLDVLRKSGHRMVLLTGGPFGDGSPNPQIAAETACLNAAGVAAKYLPSNMAPYSDMLMQALDYMEQHRPPLAHDELKPDVSQAIDRLERTAETDLEAAKAVAREVWNKHPEVRNHARFEKAIGALEALPAVAH